MKSNNVIISGTIQEPFIFSHNVFDERLYKTKIAIERTSGTVDLIPVVVSDRIIDTQTDLTNKNVCIIGQCRTYNKKDAEANKLEVVVFAQCLKCDFQPIKNNDVVLYGYICKKPSFRITALGRTISDFILAVNRSFNKSDYIPCISWSANACKSSKLDVGDFVKVSGRIQSRQYTKDNQINTTYEVSVDTIEIL